MCSGTCNTTFYRETACKWTNNYHFDTALLLSVFLGMLGADRSDLLLVHFHDTDL